MEMEKEGPKPNETTQRMRCANGRGGAHGRSQEGHTLKIFALFKSLYSRAVSTTF